MKFTVEIRDFEPGTDDGETTLRGRIEGAVVRALGRNGDDGIVIVTPEEEASS